MGESQDREMVFVCTIILCYVRMERQADDNILSGNLYLFDGR
jgi:hypothetical protein